MANRSNPRLLVASVDPALLNDIVAFCEETAGWQLVVPTSSIQEAERIIEEEQFDALLCVEELVTSSLPSLFTGPVIVVARGEAPALLREALKAGARGFVRWPQERRELIRIVSSIIGAHRTAAVGKTVALWGPKGGCGTTVLAAHLSAAIAAHGKRCVLVDLDIEHGDQASVLGAESEPRGLADLVRVIDEMSTRVLDSLTFRHPSGFRAVLASGKLGDGELTKSADLVRMVMSLTEVADYVVVDVSSGVSERSLEVCLAAHESYLVVTPDVLALRRTRDAAAMLRHAKGGSEGLKLLVNCANASLDISAQDASAVVGLPLAATVREDIGLLKSASTGELAGSGVTLLDPLARQLCGLPAARRRSLLRRG